MSANATCDFKVDITPTSDGKYLYSKECHVEVGKLVQSNLDLNKAIDLKNLALTASDNRVAMWEKTSDDQMQRLNTLDTQSKRNEWLFFGLGCLTVIGAGFMTARLIGR